MSHTISKTLLSGIGLAAAALLLAGCASGNGAGLTEEQLTGMWVAGEPGEPRLEFDGDGRAMGTDGCNGITTTYKIDGDSAQLDIFASTLMACDGVDDWLRGLRSVTLEGDTLSVFDESGKKIGELERLIS